MVTTNVGLEAWKVKSLVVHLDEEGRPRAPDARFRLGRAGKVQAGVGPKPGAAGKALVARSRYAVRDVEGDKARLGGPFKPERWRLLVDFLDVAAKKIEG